MGFVFFVLVFFLFVEDCFSTSTNNMKFTTWDQDNDVVTQNCAITMKSGWWHEGCTCANVNGLYLAGSNDLYNSGVTYVPWRTVYYSLKSTELMVRRVK